MKHANWFLGMLLACAAGAQPSDTVVLENEHFRYTIAADGRNLAFVDKSTGTDYLRPGSSTFCASALRAGTEHPARSVSLAENRLRLGFSGLDLDVTLRLEPRPSCIRVGVEAIRGDDIDALVFLNVPLTVRGAPDEPFGACALSLNLNTRVDQLPVLQTQLRAAAHRKFGIVGARVALVAMPVGGLLPALKGVLEEADEMPLCKVAGPWAKEVAFNRGSYLFNFGSLTEATVPEWIEMARSLGVTQIDNHGGGGFFRFGDFALDKAKWPDGWETFARIVGRLHEAGIDSIFHSYAFFIDKQSQYVTPVPDPRLDAFRAFTLAESVGPDADVLPVEESTAGLSTITGFFEHNSVVLHLGDELVTFGAVSQQPPWRFTGVRRGAFGTRPAAHSQGARARHLKECFGLFVPDVESSLFEEIAANHAEIVNRCGFDGLYLDAIDGSSILRGADECWYWADKFVIEIQKRLKKPVGMEMSAMWHHFWQYRTRWQAWDYPQRGHRRFIDLHASAVNGGLLLPLHLGWWNFQSFNPPQIEPTYPDVIEYLGAKLVGWDAGISLAGAINRDQLRTVPLFRRTVDILRACEELRHSGACDERVKAELRRPGQEFALATDAGGKPRFRRSRSLARIAAPDAPWSLEWQDSNPFDAQPAALRIEALMSAASYDDPRARVIADLAGSEAPLWKASTAQGVACALTDTGLVDGMPVVTLTATNRGAVPRNAAWARFERRFDPPLNLENLQALGLWIEGDGQGELVAVRLESPRHMAFGAVADRYVTVDFTGRRILTLVETESSRWSDFQWNDGKHAYNVYRETVNFAAIESVSVWLQNLPPGHEVRCRLGPIKALPMLPGALKNPTLTVNGMHCTFPADLSSGSWLEFDGTGDARLYGSKGEPIGQVTPKGGALALRPGPNAFGFSCAPPSSPPPRARVAIFARGETL
ncbi:MAG TPA: hypothetical protein PKM43_03565 [Verrucomicrobiota bacterium]|nr:hypothetical protein [Verrucomicrobiota bacterium]